MSVQLESYCLNYINGTEEKPNGDLIEELRNPNDNSFLYNLHGSSSDQVERALVSADACFNKGLWANLRVAERSTQVALMAASIGEVEDELGRVESIHNGVNIKWMQLFTRGCKAKATGYSSEAASILSIDKYPGVYGDLLSVPCPLGTAVVIAPWNAPAATIAGKVFAALLAGCSVIIKPSEHSPTSLSLLVKAMVSKCNLPAGTLQLLHGGPSVGKRLVSDPRTACVQFTGSIPSGIAVGTECAASLKPMLLELGGSNCAIVLKDANLPNAVSNIIKGITLLNGQWCVGVGRILVQDSISENFLKLLLEALSKIPIGKSDDVALPMEGIGPLAFEGHAQSLREIVSLLTASGGVAHTSTDKSLLPTDSSCFFSPTIITGVKHELCSKCELFGPLATYHTFNTIEDAILMANTCPGKLTAVIFSADENAATNIGIKLATGMVMINGIHFGFHAPPGALRPPMQYWKAAGYGIDGTTSALMNFFSRRKLVGPNGKNEG